MPDNPTTTNNHPATPAPEGNTDDPATPDDPAATEELAATAPTTADAPAAADVPTSAKVPNGAAEVPAAQAPKAGHGRTAAPAAARRRSARRPNIPTEAAAPPAPAVGGQVSESAHDRVWAALRSHPDVTTAELSAACGVARSSVTKLLAAWAEDGSATSVAGATGRAARRWTAAPSHLPPADLPPAHLPPAEPLAAAPDPANDTDSTGTSGGRGHNSGTRDGHDGGGSRRAAQTQPSRGRRGAGVPNGAGRNSSGTPRLAAGALGGMVQDYLSDHPGDHGPTAIGRALSRSSGAVANALERLVTAGWAVRSNDRPRRYHHADTTEPGPTDGTAAAAADPERAAGDGSRSD